MTRGVVIAAPASGSGKTTVTLGLLRALHRRGIDVAGAKSGPDYIDPRFHEAACGQACGNLDAFAMGPERLRSLVPATDLTIIEAAMGLFDGAPPDGRGSAADLARVLGLPVILVVDASHMAQSIRPLVRGFLTEPGGPDVAGVILNRVGSDRHARLLRHALAGLVPVLGALPRAPQIAHPARHLGLVQASERPDLEAMITAAADLVTAHVDLDAVLDVARPTAPGTPHPTPPPAQRIAVAQDEAFAFAYPHLLKDWRSQGAQILPFSPLANDPVPQADLVLLPGGYPELHAGRLAQAQTFTQSLKDASQISDIYGECGGYMTLGEVLIDAQGTAHKMAGLLPLETSFAERKLHLGYRAIKIASGPFAGAWTGHEFHYATTLRADGPCLARAQDAEGTDLGDQGLQVGRVQGSFLHLIDRAAERTP